jgi:hypothetical protein
VSSAGKVVALFFGIVRGYSYYLKQGRTINCT